MSEQGTTKDQIPFVERQVVFRPDLTATLKSLEPGNYVHCGFQWGYGTIRQMASNLGIRIQTRRTDKGITVMRTLDVPEPK